MYRHIILFTVSVVMDDVKDLCVQIDEAIVEYFSCLDDVLQIQLELDQCLKDGFFNMAKVRPVFITSLLQYSFIVSSL